LGGLKRLKKKKEKKKKEGGDGESGGGGKVAWCLEQALIQEIKVTK